MPEPLVELGVRECWQRQGLRRWGHDGSGDPF